MNDDMQDVTARISPKLSFGSWAFLFGPFAAEPWPLSRVCDYAAESGYDGVELSGFRPHAHHDDYNSDRQCGELAAMIGGHGLGISAYAPDLSETPPCEVTAAGYLEVIDRALAFCERVGINTLRVDTISEPLRMVPAIYEQRFARLAATWAATAERCAQHGVKLVWEFEPGFWLNRPSEVLRLANAIGHPNFGILFDSSHAYTGAAVGARQGVEPELLANGAVDYAQMLLPHITHLHLIDSDGSLHDDTTSAHLPFGDGQIDFQQLLAALSPVQEALPWWCIDFCFCATTEQDGRRAVPFARALAGAGTKGNV